jgi:integrase
VAREGSVKKDPESGLWFFVVDLAPPGATKRKQAFRRGYRTKKLALDALDDLKAQARTGTFVEPSRITFAGYLTKWVTGLATTGLTATTIGGYRSKVKYVVNNDFGDVPLQAIMATDLNALYSSLLTTGTPTGRGPLSASTVRALHVVINKALGDAVNTSELAHNVAKKATPPSATAAAAPEFEAWTPDELARFLGSISGRTKVDNTRRRVGEAHHHGAMFRLMAMSGIRRGEACGLRWTDLDLTAGLLTVRHTIYTVDHVAYAGGTGKTKRSRRTIDIDPVTVATLKAHRKTQLEQRTLMGAGYSDDGYVFADVTGHFWHPDTIGQAFGYCVESIRSADQKAVRDLLSRITLHGLRHTHASHLLAAGVGVKIVSARLGHSSTSFTLDTYGHVMPGDQAGAAAAAAALIDERETFCDHSVSGGPNPVFYRSSLAAKVLVTEWARQESNLQPRDYESFQTGSGRQR